MVASKDLEKTVNLLTFLSWGPCGSARGQPLTQWPTHDSFTNSTNWRVEDIFNVHSLESRHESCRSFFLDLNQFKSNNSFLEASNNDAQLQWSKKSPFKVLNLPRGYVQYLTNKNHPKKYFSRPMVSTITSF